MFCVAQKKRSAAGVVRIVCGFEDGCVVIEPGVKGEHVYYDPIYLEQQAIAPSSVGTAINENALPGTANAYFRKGATGWVVREAVQVDPATRRWCHRNEVDSTSNSNSSRGKGAVEVRCNRLLTKSLKVIPNLGGDIPSFSSLRCLASAPLDEL